MPVQSPEPAKPKIANLLPPDFSQHWRPGFLRHWRIVLFCALVLGSAVVYANYRQVHTGSVSPAGAELSPPALSGQPAASTAPVQPTARLTTTPTIWPVRGALTSGFGWRISPFGGNEFHAGVDIACLTGTPVVATADGRVVWSGWSEGYGNMVEVDHGNGLATVYGHNSQLAVSVGQAVRKGQVISYAGSTGLSTGPHVHYEIRQNSSAVDPWRYLVAAVHG